MARIVVNGEERDSYVLSVRLTDKQRKRLQSTFRNFGIEGSSVSVQLRILFRKVYWVALRHKKKQEEIQRYVQLRKERRGIPEETEEEAPEEF